GGGVKAGLVHGSSDKSGAYPKDRPVSPGDLAATIYQLVGVDPGLHVTDQTGRPLSITHGGRPPGGGIAWPGGPAPRGGGAKPPGRSCSTPCPRAAYCARRLAPCAART